MNKPKSIYILVGVFGIVFLLLVNRTKSRVESLSIEPKTESNQNVAAPSNVPVILEPDFPSNPSSPRKQVLEENVNWQVHEKKLGMKGIDLPKEGKDSIVNIELRKKLGCLPGDADAIEMDLKAAPENKLLVTFEGMSRGLKSFSWEVPVSFSSKGTASTTFKIAANRDPQQYGLYLCTAKLSNKTCQNKKVRDVNEIFSEHLRKDPGAGQEERVIFYQYFLIDDRGLSTFQGTPRGTQQFDELKEYGRLRKFQGQNSDEGIETAKNNLETLLSLPVLFEQDKLIVELPKYDAVACGESQKRK